MSKLKWLSRELVTGPYMTLCTSQEQFDAALKHLKVRKPMPFLEPHASGMVTAFEHPRYGIVCLVSIRKHKKQCPAATVGVIVHEAMHVWREYRKFIAEDDPSAEFEAYSIESITKTLLGAWADQNKPAKKGGRRAAVK